MTLQELLAEAVQLLGREKARYALAGGLAVSIYRPQPRTTNDVDFLILTKTNPEKTASRIIEHAGLKPHVVRKADLEGGPLFAIKRKNTAPYIIVGRKENEPNEPGLDFLLPLIPWFASALSRAEHNRIHFGKLNIPTLTVEDVILSKLYSASNDSKRFEDLGDLKAIFQANHSLDLAYITEQMRAHGFRLPQVIEEFAPDTLRKISKSIKR
jgi:hypothetical protein